MIGPLKSPSSPLPWNRLWFRIYINIYRENIHNHTECNCGAVERAPSQILHRLLLLVWCYIDDIKKDYTHKWIWFVVHKKKYPNNNNNNNSHKPPNVLWTRNACSPNLRLSISWRDSPKCFWLFFLCLTLFEAQQYTFQTWNIYSGFIFTNRCLFFL